ncbi:hypothetical protein SAMN04489740_4126 [Arthrobacter alpinus]|uniref:ParB/Sulfiredoxin domain-containing protein n=1 Tax=Arthrobacter alpinus TaxID=656366 RepID=A0A1H5PEY1_9MICC|nr:hypothetical protein [Arthrobacter alpinus]SEF11641.1 hypothetical protein SAMN04489740_4126 [Arthrobacter alpinus]
MIDMSTWEVLTLGVADELLLDPKNVRLDIAEGVPQADLIQDLFANEKALSLVEGITKVGFLTHEVPIVVERDKKFVVVEGNRRVAALKAIQNPLLVPDHQSKIRKLIGNDFDHASLSHITVKKAPSQDDADQLIAALHTGNQRVAWSPTRQAAFFQAQLDAGKTAEELISQYPTVDVRKFITRSRILGLFREVDYDDAAVADYTRKRRFPVSTLARLYENENFLELVGISVDDDTASVSLTANRGAFKLIATKIILDMSSGVINTRVLNRTNSASYTEYMDDLRDLLTSYSAAEHDNLGADGNESSASTSRPSEPTNTRAGTSDKTAPSSGKGKGDSDSQGSSKTKPNPPLRERNYLNTDVLSVSPDFPPVVGDILRELSKLHVGTFPNATMDLLRTFLEKTIKAYAEIVGEDIRRTGNEQGFVQLSHSLLWLEAHFKENGPKAFVQPIQRIRGGKTFVGSKEHLDATNHNHHVVTSADDVRAAWSSIESILKAVLKP